MNKYNTLLGLAGIAVVGWLIFTAKGCSATHEKHQSERFKVCMDAGHNPSECKQASY